MEGKFYENYWLQKKERLSDFDIKWPKLKKLIPLDDNLIILDFGCGHGLILKEMTLINPSANYIGVDVSETGLVQAKNNLPSGIFYKITDGGKIPLDDKSVDFIFSSEVFEHIYDINNAFSELKRILKPKGKILLTVPYHGFIKNILITIFNFNKHFNPTGPHIRFFSKKMLFGLLKKFGFDIINYGYYGRFYPISHSIWVLGSKNNE